MTNAESPKSEYLRHDCMVPRQDEGSHDTTTDCFFRYLILLVHCAAPLENRSQGQFLTLVKNTDCVFIGWISDLLFGRPSTVQQTKPRQLEQNLVRIRDVLLTTHIGLAPASCDGPL
jgi:hypothetical protein